jgi:hypothetical protein
MFYNSLLKIAQLFTDVYKIAAQIAEALDTK